mmetsp:Transcript_10964/g.10479  ORF Transcript_10964/g.10479 Transcript_10964/m.10479 type:complete len:86 (+) Transcript_10964:55-312(+)
MFHIWSNILDINVPDCANFYYTGFSWIVIFVTGGTSGVVLKSDTPWNIAYANNYSSIAKDVFNSMRDSTGVDVTVLIIQFRPQKL